MPTTLQEDTAPLPSWILHGNDSLNDEGLLSNALEDATEQAFRRGEPCIRIGPAWPHRTLDEKDNIDAFVAVGFPDGRGVAFGEGVYTDRIGRTTGALAAMGDHFRLFKGARWSRAKERAAIVYAERVLAFCARYGTLEGHWPSLWTETDAVLRDHGSESPLSFRAAPTKNAEPMIFVLHALAQEGEHVLSEKAKSILIGLSAMEWLDLSADVSSRDSARLSEIRAAYR